jgi:hypothetical protein
MLIKNLDGKSEPYHVAQGVGQALIAAGVAELHTPFEPAKLPNTTWKATEGYRGPDHVEAPVIHYSCSSCGIRGTMSGPSCEKTQKFHHCGVAESVPEDVQRQFRVLRIGWERTHKKQKPQVSAFSSNPNNLEVTGVQVLASGKLRNS